MGRRNRNRVTEFDMPPGFPVPFPKHQKRYPSKPTKIDGHLFPSRREAKRYFTLRTMQHAGLIKSLELQPRFDLHAASGELVGRYVADFRYIEQTESGWHCIVEDVKGFRTDLYKWKRRHVKAEYGIEIRET